MPMEVIMGGVGNDDDGDDDDHDDDDGDDDVDDDDDDVDDDDRAGAVAGLYDDDDDGDDDDHDDDDDGDDDVDDDDRAGAVASPRDDDDDGDDAHSEWRGMPNKTMLTPEFAPRPTAFHRADSSSNPPASSPESCTGCCTCL